MSDGVKKITYYPMSLWEQVVDYRWSQKFGTEADAVRNLVAAGLHYFNLMQDEGFQQAESQASERMNNAGLGSV